MNSIWSEYNIIIVICLIWTKLEYIISYFRYLSYQDQHVVRGTPYASDDRLPSAPATSSLFRNAFGRMTSYATRSRPASAPDRMMSRDVAWCRKTHCPDPTSRPNPTSLPTRLPSMTRWHDTYAVPYTYFLILDLSLISIISYISPHLQVDPYPFLFGSPARYVCD